MMGWGVDYENVFTTLLQNNLNTIQKDNYNFINSELVTIIKI